MSYNKPVKFSYKTMSRDGPNNVEVLSSTSVHKVFDSNVSQREVYEYYRPNILATLRGYNYVMLI